MGTSDKTQMILPLILLVVCGALGSPQRCNKGNKVCQKLEKDDPVFGGQRCKVPSDCKDEYNPYCSKWGYCISYNAFGEEGPGQSKGAVEDGTRGQCRTDADCTPWAPTCGPLGYCRGGIQDGSFGSKTNPSGGEQSDWIKKNAKSGSGRNEEYYGKIEDDNREAHVKFRKDNPIFYEQIPVLLPRLEKIEKNVYEPCTYCNYDPKSDGEYQELVGRLSNQAGKGSKNGGNGNRSNNKNQGGGKRSGNSGRNKNPGNGNRRTNKNQVGGNRSGNGNRRSNSKGNRTSGGGKSGSKGASCPGGNVGSCMDNCPSDSFQVLASCMKICSKRCA